MLNLELADALADALSDSTRIILVGDANQLPSVGPGRVLADLVEADIVPVARLTHVHRAAAESWVCRKAPRVLEGTTLELSHAKDFRFFEVDDAADAGAQVLSPQRNTACGVEALNALLQAKLNPPPGPAAEWKLSGSLGRWQQEAALGAEALP